MRTDGRTNMTNLGVAFRNFANAPNKRCKCRKKSFIWTCRTVWRYLIIVYGLYQLVCAFAWLARNTYWLSHFWPSVYLSVRCISAAPAGSIVTKFHFCENLSRNPRFSYNFRHFLWIPQYVCIVDSSTKYFVTRRQCKPNPLLRLHGNTQRVYTLDRCMWVKIQRECIIAFP
jgi:hypothetical protein